MRDIRTSQSAKLFSFGRTMTPSQMITPLFQLFLAQGLSIRSIARMMPQLATVVGVPRLGGGKLRLILTIIPVRYTIFSSVQQIRGKKTKTACG